MKRFLKEFREFAMKGNVIDLAVGVIIGAAFKDIVNSVVEDIFTPILGIVTRQVDFAKLSVNIGSTPLMYGRLIQSIVNFLVTAFCIFFIIKIMNALRNPIEVLKSHRIGAEGSEKAEKQTEEPKTDEAAGTAGYDAEEQREIVALLSDIKELLKENSGNKQ